MITKSRLRQIIQEEMRSVLHEWPGNRDDDSREEYLKGLEDYDLDAAIADMKANLAAKEQPTKFTPPERTTVERGFHAVLDKFEDAIKKYVGPLLKGPPIDPDDFTPFR